MKPVKVSELIDALEFESEDFGTWVDLQKGCVVTVENAIVTAVEEDNKELLSDLMDSEQTEVEIARAIVTDSGKRFLHPPSKFDFHEYRRMEEFISTVLDSAAAEQLWRAIKGKGAFRHFKDTAHRLGLLNEWFRYRDETMKEFVLDWAKARDVQVVDDTLGKQK